MLFIGFSVVCAQGIVVKWTNRHRFQYRGLWGM
jgi:hypothetical protein